MKALDLGQIWDIFRLYFYAENVPTNSPQD